MKKYLPALLLVASIYASMPGIAQADEISIVVSPPRYDLSLQPGESAQKTVKVTNNSSDKELILKVFAADFIVEDDLGTPVKVTEQASGRFLASPWFTLEQNELVIPPGEQKSLSVIVTAPKDAVPGGHYAGVFFEPIQARGQKTTISYTSAQVGSLFGITIAGNIKYDAIIKQFQTKLPIYEYGPVEFEATIENQSDTHIRPQASISITNMLGRKLTSLQLDEINIFPFTARTLNGAWDQVWGLGRYTATLTTSYGPGMTAERTIYFWIMPWKLIAAIIIVLATILVITISIRRHIIHRRDTRSDEIEELKRKIVELENRQ